MDDDLETRQLRAAQAKMDFKLDVPGKGAVEGVLWYFPYQNDRETVPLDPAATAARLPPDSALTQLGITNATQRAIMAGGGSVGPADGGARGRVTQGGGMTQAAAAVAAEEESEQDSAAAWWLRATAPMFEAFWQGAPERGCVFIGMPRPLW